MLSSWSTEDNNVLARTLNNSNQNSAGLPPFEMMPMLTYVPPVPPLAQITGMANIDDGPSLPPLEEMPVINFSFLTQTSAQDTGTPMQMLQPPPPTPAPHSAGMLHIDLSEL